MIVSKYMHSYFALFLYFSCILFGLFKNDHMIEF